jgi:hypothetical protein
MPPRLDDERLQLFEAELRAQRRNRIMQQANRDREP